MVLREKERRQARKREKKTKQQQKKKDLKVKYKYLDVMRKLPLKTVKPLKVLNADFIFDIRELFRGQMERL